MISMVEMIIYQRKDWWNFDPIYDGGDGIFNREYMDIEHKVMCKMIVVTGIYQ